MASYWWSVTELMCLHFICWSNIYILYLVHMLSLLLVVFCGSTCWCSCEDYRRLIGRVTSDSCDLGTVQSLTGSRMPASGQTPVSGDAEGIVRIVSIGDYPVGDILRCYVSIRLLISHLWSSPWLSTACCEWTVFVQFRRREFGGGLPSKSIESFCMFESMAVLWRGERLLL
jgi:hypothetical protein